MTAEFSSLIEQALGTLRAYVERVGYHEAAGLGSTEHAEECRHCAALAALDSLASLVAEREAELEQYRAQIGSHVCETEDGSWRPCPAALCEGARLLVESHHDAAEQVRRIAELEQALRPFAENWDFHAADYLANLVDGEEARVLPARVVSEIIAAVKVARDVLARSVSAGHAGDETG